MARIGRATYQTIHKDAILALAEPPGQCENAEMRKLYKTAVAVLAASTILLGNAKAQQTPASTPPQAPSANAQQGTAAKAPKSPATKAPAAKTGQSPATSGKAPAAKDQTTMALDTPRAKASYAVGLNIGKSLRRDAVDIDPIIFQQGLKDGLTDAKALLTDDEMKATMTAVQADLRKRQETEMAQAGEANKKEGDVFLAANKTKEGVVALPSGLQYKILKEGTGAKPTASDTVVCNYKGTLIDGKEFDSSYKRGQPATFPVGQVIKGWTEALQIMPVGSKWQLFIPSELAYGPRGPSPDIGPNATLIFEVELLSIQSK
jgi:FKBP-type peptidyl-prolyl cis-trans isomerase FklB